jgi:hypothetical protein
LPDRPVARHPALLPADVASFTARSADLAELDRALLGASRPDTGCRVVMLTGTAGVGRTALAVQ